MRLTPGESLPCPRLQLRAVSWFGLLLRSFVAENSCYGSIHILFAEVQIRSVGNVRTPGMDCRALTVPALCTNRPTNSIWCSPSAPRVGFLANWWLLDRAIRERRVGTTERIASHEHFPSGSSLRTAHAWPVSGLHGDCGADARARN